MQYDDNFNAWDLFRKGHLDQEKHLKILEKTLKDNITDLISHGKIIAGDNIIIPVKHLKQYKFVYEQKQEGTIAMPDDASDKQEGDIIGEKPQKGQGDQGKGGSGEGDGGYYEVVVNSDDIAEYLFQNMELPRLKKKKPKDAYKEEYKMSSISKTGSMSNLQKKKTIQENIKRNASKGDAKFKDIINEDLRYRSHRIKQVPQDKVVCIFIRDRSASMDDYKKELTRIMSFWFLKFLEYKYSKVVEKAFISFDTKAEEVSEYDFIHKSEGGGTAISSGFAEADRIIQERYPLDDYNIYIFQFTDGDNWEHDNENADQYIDYFSSLVNLLGVCHIRSPFSFFGFTFGNSNYIKNVKNKSIESESVKLVEVSKQEEIVFAMEDLFGAGDNDEI